MSEEQQWYDPLLATMRDDWAKSVTPEQCNSVRKRQERVLDLFEAQVKTVKDFQETPVINDAPVITEKNTRLVQNDVKNICAIFEELTSTSETREVLRAIGHPDNGDLDTIIDNIKNQCGICRLPLIPGLPEREWKHKRFNCLMAEEAMTNAAHHNQLIEEVLMDSRVDGFQRVIAGKFKGFQLSHEFYENMLHGNVASATKFIERNRKTLQETVC